MTMPLGKVPTSTLDDVDNVIFCEGDAPKKASYSDMKNDILGIGTLTTTAQTIKGAINELDADVGDKTQLPTTDKTSLVNSIKEINTSLADAAHKTGSLQTNLNSEMLGGFKIGSIFHRMSSISTGTILANINTLVTAGNLHGTFYVTTETLTDQPSPRWGRITYHSYGDNVEVEFKVDNSVDRYVRNIHQSIWYDGWSPLSVTKITDLTLINGWVINYLPAKITINGRIVTLNIRIKNGTVASSTNICTIPTGYYPVSGIIVPVINANGTVIGSVQILETGNMSIVGAFSSNTDAIINASYYIA